MRTNITLHEREVDAVGNPSQLSLKVAEAKMGPPSPSSARARKSPKPAIRVLLPHIYHSTVPDSPRQKSCKGLSAFKLHISGPIIGRGRVRSRSCTRLSSAHQWRLVGLGPGFRYMSESENNRAADSDTCPTGYRACWRNNGAVTIPLAVDNPYRHHRDLGLSHGCDCQ
jgi:hypothetical protein